ncbi:MAG: tetratricopeptide repeat protein [Desulfuromonadia bacterium]
MSSKKEKLIESATRFIVKGQIDRAIKEYEQIVSLDPGDVRNRQKLAELLVRQNRKAEAIAEFTNVAQYYVKNSFYLKAIAVYKQIRKLDPDNPALALALADLNLKQGMTGNAIVEFSEALALYERDRNLPEMQRVLQMMQEADPDNLSLKLKGGELLLSLGKRGEALSAFVDLAMAMDRQGKEIARAELEERVKELFPGEPFHRLVAQRFRDIGDIHRARRYLGTALETNGADLAAWNLLIECLELLPDPPSLDAALEEMIRRFPNEPTPRERLIRRLLDASDPQKVVRLLESSAMILMAAGKIDMLIDSFRKVSALMPGDPSPLVSLRDLLRTAGHPLLPEVEKELAVLTEGSPDISLLLDETGESSPTSLNEPEVEIEIDLSEFENGEPVDTGVGSSPHQDFSVDWESEGLDLGEIELIPSIPESPPPPEPPPVSRQKRVKLGEEIDGEDLATIYDLAIAYKEMGLFDEAIEQFEIVARDPKRRVDSMTLQGVCHREKGHTATAEKLFLKALTLPAAPHERLCAQYELAEIYLQQGKKREALKLFREIFDADPEYRETAGHIERLVAEEPERYLSDQLVDMVKEQA